MSTSKPTAPEHRTARRVAGIVYAVAVVVLLLVIVTSLR